MQGDERKFCRLDGKVEPDPNCPCAAKTGAMDAHIVQRVAFGCAIGGLRGG